MYLDPISPYSSGLWLLQNFNEEISSKIWFSSPSWYYFSFLIKQQKHLGLRGALSEEEAAKPSIRWRAKWLVRPATLTPLSLRIIFKHYMCSWDLFHNRYGLSEDLVWYVRQSEAKAVISSGDGYMQVLFSLSSLYFLVERCRAQLCLSRGQVYHTVCSGDVEALSHLPVWASPSSAPHLQNQDRERKVKCDAAGHGISDHSWNHSSNTVFENMDNP